MSYCVRWLFWGHLFLAWNASVNPVPAQAIADTRKSVADRLQLGFVTSREKLASVITALPTLSVRVTRYAVDTDAFQFSLPKVYAKSQFCCISVKSIQTKCHDLCKFRLNIQRDCFKYWVFNSLYTDVVLFFFSFFWKLNIGEHAGEARESERGTRERNKYFLLPPPLPSCAGVNKSPAVYFLSRALNGLWRENRGWLGV